MKVSGSRVHPGVVVVAAAIIAVAVALVARPAPGAAGPQEAAGAETLAQGQPPPVSSQVPAPGGGAVQSTDRGRTIAMIGIIVLAVVYLRLAEQEPREPRSLIAFGRDDRETGSPEA